MPSRTELVAHNRDSKAIAEAIGADLVIYQTLPDLISAVRQLNPVIEAFDCSVFTGEYVTGGVDESYLQYLESLRADNAKSKAQIGDIGTMEGKGGGAAQQQGLVNLQASKEDAVGCSGPMNGADDTTVAVPRPTWLASAHEQPCARTR